MTNTRFVSLDIETVALKADRMTKEEKKAHKQRVKEEKAEKRKNKMSKYDKKKAIEDALETLKGL